MESPCPAAAVACIIHNVSEFFTRCCLSVSDLSPVPHHPSSLNANDEPPTTGAHLRAFYPQRDGTGWKTGIDEAGRKVLSELHVVGSVHIISRLKEGRGRSSVVSGDASKSSHPRVLRVESPDSVKAFPCSSTSSARPLLPNSTLHSNAERFGSPRPSAQPSSPLPLPPLHLSLFPDSSVFSFPVHFLACPPSSSLALSLSRLSRIWNLSPLAYVSISSSQPSPPAKRPTPR